MSEKKISDAVKRRRDYFKSFISLGAVLAEKDDTYIYIGKKNKNLMYIYSGEIVYAANKENAFLKALGLEDNKTFKISAQKNVKYLTLRAAYEGFSFTKESFKDLKLNFDKYQISFEETRGELLPVNEFEMKSFNLISIEDSELKDNGTGKLILDENRLKPLPLNVKENDVIFSLEKVLKYMKLIKPFQTSYTFTKNKEKQEVLLPVTIMGSHDSFIQFIGEKYSPNSEYYPVRVKPEEIDSEVQKILKKM